MKILLIISLCLCLFLAGVLYWLSVEIEEERYIREQAVKTLADELFRKHSKYDLIKIVVDRKIHGVDTIVLEHHAGYDEIIKLNQ